MPELPEVEAARALAEAVAVGRRVVAADVVEDPLIFEGVPPERLAAALVGRRVEAARRRGKVMWLALDAGPSLVLHLGMTGSVRAPDREGPAYRTGPADDGGAWPPRFTRLRLHLSDGGELAYTNARRFGRVRLVDDPAAVPPVSRLGFDPLLDLPDAAAFAARVRARKAPIKALLLDQGFAAGVGNWIADEALYQAGVAPRRRACDLAEAEAEAVRAALDRVITTAVAAGARSDRFPPGWLFHVRWGRQEGATTAAGEAVAFDTVGGRTTAWVPTRQR